MPARDEVIDQHAEVRLAALRQSRALFAARMQPGIDAGQQSLGRSLLVAGRAVDLAGEEQAADGAGSQATARQVARIEIIVFDGVARAGQVRLLEAAMLRTSSYCTSKGRLVEMPFGYTS